MVANSSLFPTVGIEWRKMKDEHLFLFAETTAFLSVEKRKVVLSEAFRFEKIISEPLILNFNVPLTAFCDLFIPTSV